MEKFEGKNLLNFIKELPDDNACRAYLAKYKWSDGFKCPKCGHEKGCLKKNFSYYCYKCLHVETATANTLFHKVKFGLHKTFCMVFEMVTSSKSLSSVQMGERYGVSQTSTWGFMHKVRTAMESSKKYPLSDSCKSLTPIFEEHISEKAEITTDKWNGYNPLKKKYNITQIESDKGKNFKKLHIVIHQIKSWLRTIMVHVSKKHIERYFNEFCYRINRSQSKINIFHNTILRMIKHNNY